MTRTSILATALAALVGTACDERVTPPLAPAPSASAPATSSGAAGSSGSGGGADDSTVTLLSWNLEDYPKTGETGARVAAILDEIRPDVVGVEELPDDGTWQALADALTAYDGIVATAGDGYSRVGILYRPDRVGVTDPETLFENDGYAFPRPMLVARVTSVPRPANEFVLGIVHLKAQLDQESENRRRDACMKLDQWIAGELAQGSADDIVIAGDFNDQLTDPPQWNVFGPLLTATDGGFLTLAPEEAGGYTYIPFTSFIDHVHVRGASLPAASSAEVVPLDQTHPGYEDTVSDHRPVLARLRFAP